MFETALREGVRQAQERMMRARREGLSQEEFTQAARLLDLVDRARDNNIDIKDWVDPELLAAALASAGDT